MGVAAAVPAIVRTTYDVRRTNALVRPIMSTLFENQPLILRGGTKVKDGASLLKGKADLLLFSSAWCPDCKPFCGIVKKFLAQLRDGSNAGDVEVVWVSSDRSAEAAEVARAQKFDSGAAQASVRHVRRCKKCRVVSERLVFRRFGAAASVL